MKGRFLSIVFILYFVPLTAQIVVSPGFHAVQYVHETASGQACPGTPELVDERDGNVYPTVLIGYQCWMAKNLAYLPSLNAPGTGSNIERYFYVYDYYGTDINEAKATDNYINYGVLYNWVAAMNGAESSSTNPSDVQGICPPGWHLPSDSEWGELIGYIASQDYPNQPNNPNAAGNVLKSCRQVNSPLGGNCNTSEHPRWNSHNTHFGFDEYNFSALPAGYYRHSQDIFDYIGVSACWWSATEKDSTSSWLRYIRSNDGYVLRVSSNMEVGKPVRCIKDCPVPNQVTDSMHTSGQTQITWSWSPVDNANGYKYNTTDNYWGATDNDISTTFTQTDLECGETYNLFVWAYNECGYSEVMDLKSLTQSCPCEDVPLFTDDRDGNVYPTVQIGNQCWMAKNLAYLPEITFEDDWWNDTIPQYAVYGYAPGSGTETVAGAKATENYNNYGVLYNKPAALISCPPGWILPRTQDFDELLSYINEQEWSVGGREGKYLKSCRQENSPLGDNCNTNEHPRWDSSSYYGTDVFGFNALPAGYKLNNFEHIGVEFIMRSDNDLGFTNHYIIKNNSNGVFSYDWYAFDAVGYSVRCIKECPVPSQVSGSTHTTNQTQIIWNWNSVDNADGYKYNNTDDYLTATDNGTSTSFTQTDLECGETYNLFIWAYNECGYSEVLELNEVTEDCPPIDGEPCPGTPTVTFTYNGEEVTYGTVVSSGRCWLDRNLGASRVAISSTDEQAYGDLFQWGRGADGHQLIDRDAGEPISGTTDILSNSDNPEHSDFIITISSSNDWRSPENDQLWQAVSGINNPCPPGWRIPTQNELEIERQRWSSNNTAGAFASPLKLPAAGRRSSTSGLLIDSGSSGYLWSLSSGGVRSQRLSFYITAALVSPNHRAMGYSVRCTKM